MPESDFVYLDGDKVDVGAPIDNDFVYVDGELLDDGGQSSVAFVDGRGVGLGAYPLMLVGQDGNDVLVEGFSDTPYTLTSTGSSDFVRSLDVNNASFSYRDVAYGSQNGDVHVVDIDNRQKRTVVTPFGSSANVISARYHHSNDWLAASGGAVKVLDSASGYGTLQTLTGPNSDDRSPAWTSNYLMFTSYTFNSSSSDDQALVVVDPSTWSTVNTTSGIGSTDAVQASVDRNNGWYAVDTGSETTIFSTTSPWGQVTTVPATADQVEFSPGGDWLAVGSTVYETSGWTQVYNPSDSYTPIAFGPNGDLAGWCGREIINNTTTTKPTFVNTGSWTVDSTYQTTSAVIEDEFLLWFEHFNYS